MKKFLLLFVAFALSLSLSAQITKNFEDQNLTSGGWTAVSVTGDQVWTVPSTTYGHNDTYCGKMTGYDGASFENEDWFISPSFNADEATGLSLEFWNAKGYTGDQLVAYYSNDYNGSDVSGATWTEITGITWHDGVTFWEWTNSGTIDLSSLTGTSVYIAFKYTSNTTESTTWELDDITISGVTSTKEATQSKISVYPNPVVNTLYITENANVTVYNITGAELMSATNTNTIDVSNLETGVYFVQIATVEGTTTQKIIKK
ncbi:MAG: choice-of-anchor J domain-containing protein [Bacteroidales bacterium]|nr:choice-of-anchor J domain-containing protein [Bacteroidales bacterium]